MNNTDNTTAEKMRTLVRNYKEKHSERGKKEWKFSTLKQIEGYANDGKSCIVIENKNAYYLEAIKEEALKEGFKAEFTDFGSLTISWD